jgi:Rps23 Pro-64 3,4-dihydroxylase Tpa1-like proline 4-hydroxylase
MPATTDNNIFQYPHWEGRLADLHQRYYHAEPYPHIVLDNFLQKESANRAYQEFPSVNDSSWINYLHINERKHGFNKMNALPAGIQAIIRELNSKQFAAFLSRLTGINNLISDPELEGGGLHQSQRGGFLNIHSDFTVHPHHKNRRRRVNLIVYLNPDWKDEYNGHLELWSKDMKRCVQKIAPLLNRCVIFNTDADSYHGHPDKLNCPTGTTRKSIALYYYTEEKNRISINATNYKARPGDGIKKLWIYMDKQALSLYTRIKSAFGLSDDFASKILRFLSVSKRNKK